MCTFWLSREVAISEFMREIKANSSGWLRETVAGYARFSWQAGYGAFTVSQSQVIAVKNYISGQKAHHRKKTFQEEFLEFLQQHNLAYDERYIWA